VTAIESSVGNNPIETFAYSYDALNRPISRNSDIFGYNERSEVVEASILGNLAKYGYDEIGNSTNWLANSLNQYNHLQYDLDGNLLTDGNLVFSYDAANRLKTVSSNGVLVLMNFYDAKSRRVKKVTQNATTTFFYDDWNLIEERIAYANGTTSTIHYYWGKDLSGTLQGAGGVGGLLYQTVDGAIYIPCYDNNGNVTKYIDSNGNIAASYTYDAFGNLISKSGSLADFFRHRFSTKYFDTESNLYYYGYRFYHPILMRWLNRDPIEENGGMNLYGFCGNTNIGYDRLGLYVNIVYDVKEKTLSATDVDTRESITLKGKVISGNGKSCCVKEDQWRVGEGPLPVGRYLVGLSYIPNAHLNDSEIIWE
jgi:RHS repeat-associated protein